MSFPLTIEFPRQNNKKPFERWAVETFELLHEDTSLILLRIEKFSNLRLPSILHSMASKSEESLKTMVFFSGWGAIAIGAFAISIKTYREIGFDIKGLIQWSVVAILLFSLWASLRDFREHMRWAEPPFMTVLFRMLGVSGLAVVVYLIGLVLGLVSTSIFG